MLAFAALVSRLRELKHDSERLPVLKKYFDTVSQEDLPYSIAYLQGIKQKRLVTADAILKLAAQASQEPIWLLEACKAVSTDNGEIAALLCCTLYNPNPKPLRYWLAEVLPAYYTLTPTELEIAIVQNWQTLSREEGVLWNKILMANLRITISTTLLANALAQRLERPAGLLSNRLPDLKREMPVMERWATITAAVPDDYSYSSPTVTINEPTPTLTIHAVLLYLRTGIGGKAEELTFAVKSTNDDVYTWASIARLEAAIPIDARQVIELHAKHYTMERFGPVKMVVPKLVFALSCQAVVRSARHKAGIQLQGLSSVELLTDVTIEAVHSLPELASWVQQGY